MQDSDHPVNNYPTPVEINSSNLHSEANMSQRFKKWFFLLLGLLIITVVASSTWLSVEQKRAETEQAEATRIVAEDNNQQLLDRLHLVFDSFFAPTEVQLIHTNYQGCGQHGNASVGALYTTNSHADTIRSLYKSYLQSTGWSNIGEWEARENDRVTQWGLTADWPFEETDPRQQSFMLLASASEITTIAYVPTEALGKATASGKTTYTVAIFYNLEKDVPHGNIVGSRIKRCYVGWWEIDEPAK